MTISDLLKETLAVVKFESWIICYHDELWELWLKDRLQWSGEEEADVVEKLLNQIGESTKSGK